MEDAHIAYDDLTAVSQVRSPEPLSVFGVFDGHGGKEVAKFAQCKFAAELVALAEFKEGKYEAALRKAFHRIDELLEDSSCDPLLDSFRQIPNPSDRDRRNVGTASRTCEAGGYKMTASPVPAPSQTPAAPALPPQGPIGPTLSVMETEKRLTQSLQKLLVREGTEGGTEFPEMESRQPSAPVSEGGTGAAAVAVPKTASAPATEVPKPGPTISVPGPIPGPDRPMVCQLKDHRVMAGCTAVVAFKRGNMLYVANAGDSRAVLCRADGVALPLSEDHKPNQPRELARIHAAGGFVTQIGRVNGNLNLSRSLGDLKYKQVPGVTKEGQIISAEPDVSVTELRASDRFLVMACDGVWDCMSSQQAVTFVSERLDQGLSLRVIVEQALKHCVAEDPRKSGGIGGDNMTFLLVVFSPPSSASASTSAAAPNIEPEPDATVDSAVMGSEG